MVSSGAYRLMHAEHRDKIWWARMDLNHLPQSYQDCALPVELRAHNYFCMYRNTKKQGDAALGAAIAWFTRNQYTVCLPLTDSQDYDLIVEKNDQLQRVQVRSSRTDTIGLRVLGGNSKRNFVHRLGTDLKYDLLFAVCSTGQYVIPKSTFAEHRNTLVLRAKWKSYLVDVEGIEPSWPARGA